MDGIKHHKPCVLQKWSCYVNTLSFNSVVCSLGVCVCIYAFTGVYTARAYDRMRFDGFLALMYLHFWVCFSVCGSVCEWEEFTCSNPGNTHDCMWLGCEAQQTSSTNSAAGAGPAKPPGCKRPSALRDVGLAWKHLGGDVLFQALRAGGERCRNYLCGFSASFSAACTITSTKRGMESEKDLSRGCGNSRYTGRVTYWMWDVGLFVWVLDEEHLNIVCVYVCVRVRIPFLLSRSAHHVHISNLPCSCTSLLPHLKLLHSWGVMTMLH